MKTILSILFCVCTCAPRIKARACDLEHGLSQLEIILKESSFETQRDITSYAAAFKDGFLKKLRSLNERHTWIDFGAGRGVALNDYAQPVNTKDSPDFWIFEGHPRLEIMLSFSKSGNRARTVGLVVKKETDLPTGKRIGPYKQYSWPVVENHHPVEIIENRVEDINFQKYKISTAQLITDYNGAFSYSLNPLQVLRAALKILSDDGEMYFNIPSRNFVIVPSGEKVALWEWLQDFSDFKLTAIKQPFVWKLTRRLQGGSKSLNKMDLKLTELLAGSAPLRTFQEMTQAPGI